MRKGLVPFYCVVLVSCMMFFSCNCNRERRAIRQMCETMHADYPAATLQDIYKTCYQDFFGAEHMVSDSVSARYYLHQELEECRDANLDLMPEMEFTGFRHRFVRVNLSAVIKGNITEEQLLALFLKTAGRENRIEGDWAEEWEKIAAIAVKTCPEWDNPELKQLLSDAAKSDQAMRHSESFRNSYAPHYRIVNRKLYPRGNS